MVRSSKGNDMGFNLWSSQTASDEEECFWNSSKLLEVVNKCERENFRINSQKYVYMYFDEKLSTLIDNIYDMIIYQINSCSGSYDLIFKFNI